MTKENKPSLQVFALKVYVGVFISLDFLTSLTGIHEGMPANEPIKVLGAIVFSILIATGVLCTRIILELEESTLKWFLVVIPLACIALDGWTSFEGLHRLIIPGDEDYFGWFLLILATAGCIASPITGVYFEKIKSKFEVNG